MAIHIRRRELIVALGGTAMTWPLAARAQQPKLPVIGRLNARSPDDTAHLVAAFGRGLGEGGLALAAGGRAATPSVSITAPPTNVLRNASFKFRIASDLLRTAGPSAAFSSIVCRLVISVL